MLRARLFLRIRRHRTCSYASIVNRGNILTWGNPPTSSAMASPQNSSSAGLPHPVSMQVKFWGVRGSIPTPGPTTVHYGGNTSCIEVRAGDQIVILDAGTGLRLLGQDLLAEFGERPLNLTLLLTHTHWDHI